jgi:hypothetical protein
MSCQRALMLIVFVIVVSFNGYGQVDYSEQEYGKLITKRNDPFPKNKQDSTIIQCRKLDKVDKVFHLSTSVLDISKTRLKHFKNLTDVEKVEIIIYLWNKRDTTLLPIVLKIAQTDTLSGQEYVRKLSVKCLSRFNTNAVKKVLNSLLNDKEVGMISALSLVQLGQTEQAFQYIQTHYNESISYRIIPDIVTSLMIVNTPAAIELLKEISVHKDPSQALDALAALSLLGYCDFAYQGFCRYTNSKVRTVRTKVANCLLYYIGTDHAIKTVKNMYCNEKDPFVKNEIEYLLQKYNIKE